jgi:hypothetical protein
MLRIKEAIRLFDIREVVRDTGWGNKGDLADG